MNSFESNFKPTIFIQFKSMNNLKTHSRFRKLIYDQIKFNGGFAKINILGWNEDIIVNTSKELVNLEWNVKIDFKSNIMLINSYDDSDWHII